MKHKSKKQDLDTIVQKMGNDYLGNYLAELLKIADVVLEEKRIQGCLNLDSSEVLETVKKIDWLYGYESEIKETFESLRIKLDKKIFDKDSSRVTLTSWIACYCVLTSILDGDDEEWGEPFLACNNSRVLECIENLKRHCVEKIELKGFLDARSYIRIWDKEYNW